MTYLQRKGAAGEISGLHEQQVGVSDQPMAMVMVS